ncbi:MAG: hypothetical protein B7Z66_15770 [Chromatiales bacterium 21-64-14]|nr:MAG: hypothetical protein B7Z66_15770 [Chromatiales bacterium 21-64-14]
MACGVEDGDEREAGLTKRGGGPDQCLYCVRVPRAPGQGAKLLYDKRTGGDGDCGVDALVDREFEQVGPVLDGELQALAQ